MWTPGGAPMPIERSPGRAPLRASARTVWASKAAQSRAPYTNSPRSPLAPEVENTWYSPRYGSPACGLAACASTPARRSRGSHTIRSHCSISTGLDSVGSARTACAAGSSPSASR